MSDPIRVLYADASPADRQRVREWLEKEPGGFSVIEAVSGGEFEERLARGGFDIVLSELNISGLEGTRLIDRVKTAQPDLPLIIVSGCGSLEKAVEAMRHGAADFLKKSSGYVEKLPSSIRAVLEKEQFQNIRRLEIEALQKREENLRHFVEALPQVIFEMDIRGQVVFSNQAALEVFGLSEEDLKRGVNAQDVIAPEDWERARSNIERGLRGEKLGGPEYQALRKDGSRFPVRIYSVPVMKDGQPAGLRGIIIDVSEWKADQEALKRSEERYRQVVELSDDGIVWTQGDRHMFANRKMAEIFGYNRPEELLGQSVMEVTHPDDRDRVLRIHGSRLRGEEAPTCYEFKGIRKNGEALYIEVSAIRTFFHGEWGSLAYLRDITERRKAEKELQESRELFQTLVEMSNDAITMVKGDMHIYVNPKMVEIFGYERADEITGHSVLQMVHPDDRERVVEINRRRQKGEPVPAKYVFRGIRKDGRLIFLETSAKRLEYRGEIVSQVFLRDITERVQAEEELKASEEKYRLVVENANEGILVLQDGLIIFANPRAAQIVRYSRQDLQSRPFTDFVFPEDRDKVFSHYRNRISGESSPQHYTLRLVDFQGGTVWVEANIIVISWEGRPAALVFSTDITEKKQLEMQFLQAQKMEAVGRLAGGVAHDFNNLLTSILGHSDLMMMRLRSGDPLVGDIKEITKAANRATDLTRQLLAFSRKQVMQPRILNLNAIISDMKKMLQRLIGEDIILETLLPPTLGPVLVDPGQIDQVIMNLVVNARDAMPKGGTLTIETSNTLLDEIQVRSYIGAKPGAYVLLSVKDSGSGMSEELQSYIFEPFFTTKELGKGTGLGLSTVYGIVKQSNGYIWVDSRPGQGTAFKIFLPRQEGEAESDLKLERGKVSLRGKETILLAEDNDLVRGLTRSVLEHFGYRVLETEDGEEAGRMSKGYEGPIHLLLTDVVMPGVGGRVLAEQLQISRPGIKILFMSGYSEEAALLQGMQNLGAHFLQKPFTPEELGLRVREILDSA
jgi:PAS domain S-box-containing protein